MNPDWNHAGSRQTAATALADIASARPATLVAAALAKRSKLPFKAALYRDSLLWRIEELGRAALQAYDLGDHVSAILITRGLMETVAALHSLHHRITHYKGGDPDGLDKTLMSMTLGSRSRDDRPDALNILGAIDKLTKKIPAFRSLYDELSEYAHPNDAGTAYSFSVLTEQPLSARFTPRGEYFDRRAWLMVECLATTLLLVMPVYRELLTGAPAFAALCDLDVAAD